jgi:hypothetical protein
LPGVHGVNDPALPVVHGKPHLAVPAVPVAHPAAVPSLNDPIDAVERRGVQRMVGSAANWTHQLRQAVLAACSMCCPNEFTPMSNILPEETNVWLTQMCRFLVQHHITFTPSPEEASIMIRDPARWADVVAYNPAMVEYAVVFGSTLVWGHKNRARYLMNLREKAVIHAQFGAEAKDYTALLTAIESKEVLVIMLWNSAVYDNN